MRSSRALPRVLLCLAIGLAARGRAFAQDDGSVRPPGPPSDRLSLVVHGKVKGVADEVEIEFVVEASSEEAQEAERLQRGKLKRVVAALEELRRELAGEKPEARADGAAPDAAKGETRTRKKKARGDDDEADAPPSKEKKAGKKGADGADADAAGDELEQVPIVVREGRSIFGLARESNQPADKGANTTVATAVQVVMTGLAQVPRPALRKRLAKIVDKAIEAGADSGGADSGGPIGKGVRPAFRWKVKDNEALREAAYKVAVATGRARAERLARFAGREIEVLSTLRETGWQLRAGSGEEGAGFDVVVGRVGNNRPNNHDLLVSTTECELEVALELEFQLKPVAPAEPATPPPVPAPAGK